MNAFLSYQNTEKLVARRVQEILESFPIPSFLAHEDIDVSGEWRSEILKKLRKTDIFIPILSKHFNESVWCHQESGIAAFRKMTIIPLSIDGTAPQGFLSQFQSTKINPDSFDRRDLFPGIAKCDVAFLIDCLVRIVRLSSSFRGAEANFELVLPYLEKATDEQIVELLHVSTFNSQVCNAGLCAQKYLPPLVKSHGHLMVPAERRILDETLQRYVF